MQAANAADSGADESDQLLYEMLASFGVGGAPAASGPTAAAAAAAAAAAVEQPASEPPASSRPTAAAAAVEQPVPAPAVAQAPATPAAAPAPAPAAAGCTADQPSGAHVGGTAAGLDPALLADLACPLTLELMHDPVVAADGCTYERAAIAGAPAGFAAGGAQVGCRLGWGDYALRLGVPEHDALQHCAVLACTAAQHGAQPYMSA